MSVRDIDRENRMMDDSAIAVLTREGVGEIIHRRGVGGLTLQPRHARKQRYVVCVRNDRNANPEAGEPHGTALVVGMISGVEVSGQQTGAQRWRLTFERFARVSIPGVWKRWRNPVIYTSLSELGIDPSGLDFSLSEASVKLEEAVITSGAPLSLTILQAKAGLARGLGLRPDQIEITIKA